MQTSVAHIQNIVQDTENLGQKCIKWWCYIWTTALASANQTLWTPKTVV